MSCAKRRVCMIMGGHWATVMGGAQYQARCLLDEMVKREEFEISYLSRVVDLNYPAEGYRLVRIAENKGLRHNSFFFDARRLIRLLKDIRPHVIYQRGLKSYTGIAAYYAARYGSRFIFHIAHDYDVSPFRAEGPLRQWGPKWVEKKWGEYGLKHAHSVIAQTRHQASLSERHYGRRAAAVIPNFHPFPTETVDKSQGPVKVVWVANFKPVKRPEMFVKLAEDLREEKDTEFIMIGRPGPQGLYRSLHQRISKQENLTYLGERPIDEVNRILAGAHIFVNTSIAEGFPNTFIQAWMRHVPVVSATVNTDGVFDAQQVGFCDGTYEYMKTVIKRLIRDPGLRSVMGESARSHAFKHHSTSNAQELISMMLAS